MRISHPGSTNASTRTRTPPPRRLLPGRASGAAPRDACTRTTAGSPPSAHPAPPVRGSCCWKTPRNTLYATVGGAHGSSTKVQEPSQLGTRLGNPENLKPSVGGRFEGDAKEQDLLPTRSEDPQIYDVHAACGWITPMLVGTSKPLHRAIGSGGRLKTNRVINMASLRETAHRSRGETD